MSVDTERAGGLVRTGSLRSADAPVAGWRSTSRWIMVLVVASAITWRSNAIYSGGIDAVVAAKAILSCLALVLAWVARVGRGSGRPMGTTFVWLALGFVAVSTFGAFANGTTLMASGVLSVRLLILTAILVLLVKTYPAEQLVTDLASTSTAIVLIAAVTGVPGYLAGERLRGGVPDMHSNELAALACLPLILLFFLVLRGTARPRHVILLVALLGIVWATGSRTTLVAVLVAFGILLLGMKKLPTAVAAVVGFAMPAAVYLLYATDVVTGFVNRSGPGEGDILTLNSRLFGWSEALEPTSEWARWFGNGLSVKEVSVQGQYWDTQPLDSSWVSAIVQAGWIGVALLLVWVVLAFAKLQRLPSPAPLVLSAVLVMLLIRSVLENGLVDSSVAFVTFMLIALISDRAPRPTTFARGDGDPSPSSARRPSRPRTAQG